MCKVRSTGLDIAVCKWIENWLKDRIQRVVVNDSYSEWSKVINGVSQGSVLGPLLFNIFINDIGSEIKSNISVFADDTKLCSGITSLQDVSNLQANLNALSNWATKWQMRFNVDKCKVMHLGAKNMHASYMLGGVQLGGSVVEKDLGVLVDHKLNNGMQCQAAVSKASKVLSCIIKRGMDSRDRDIILPLYKSLVRPHLEYAVQFWAPVLKKDIRELEKVQRRATKLIRGMEELSYEERLEELNLFTLEKRRIRGDMINIIQRYSL